MTTHTRGGAPPTWTTRARDAGHPLDAHLVTDAGSSSGFAVPDRPGVRYTARIAGGEAIARVTVSVESDTVLVVGDARSPLALAAEHQAPVILVGPMRLPPAVALQLASDLFDAVAVVFGAEGAAGSWAELRQAARGSSETAETPSGGVSGRPGGDLGPQNAAYSPVQGTLCACAGDLMSRYGELDGGVRHCRRCGRPLPEVTVGDTRPHCPTCSSAGPRLPLTDCTPCLDQWHQRAEAVTDLGDGARAAARPTGLSVGIPVTPDPGGPMERAFDDGDPVTAEVDTDGDPLPGC